MILYLPFDVLGNPGVVQRQGVFQQNVSNFPANPALLHQNQIVQSETISRGETAAGARMLPSLCLLRWIEATWNDSVSSSLPVSYIHAHTHVMQSLQVIKWIHTF